MVICYILGCKSRSERKCENITFHTFPKDSTIRQIWIRATRRDNWILSKYARICSKHFERNCFRKTSRNVYLKAYSVPTLHITAKKVSTELERSAGEMEEGQEEWLSDENLTDEEYHPAANDIPSPDNSSQDDPITSANDESVDTESQDNIKDSTKIESIENTLNSLENENKKDLDGLEQFLIRKSEGKLIASKSTEKSDDGNDTDDLLRLLGEEDDKSKKKILVKSKDQRKLMANESSDDDNFIFEGSSVTKLKVDKKGLKKRNPATKALPEDMSDTDGTDASGTPTKLRLTKKVLKKKFPASKAVPENVDSDPTDASIDEGESLKRMFIKQKSTPSALKSSKVVNATKTVVKKYVIGNGVVISDEPAKKQEAGKNKAKVGKEVLKTVTKPAVSKHETKLKRKTSSPEPEPDEIINEEEFLEDDDFDLDEDFGNTSDVEDFDISERQRQLLRKPEQMDEEVPSDPESFSDDNSLYDELPSSDSDDLDEYWFDLDLRAERASDYLPLLGAKAYDLLSEEKQRVTERLASLKKNITSVSEKGRQQVEQMKKTKKAITELDDMLKAT